jgi:hypothetical protein
MKNTFEQMCRPLLQSFDKKFKIISVNSSSRNTSHKSEGLTEQICNQLKDKDNYIIFISPEGTRKCTNKLRTGYWYIAKNLNINIIYLGIDYQSKEINMEKCRKPFETWEEEEDYFIKTCVKYTPLYPERCYWTKNYYE